MLQFIVDSSYTTEVGVFPAESDKSGEFLAIPGETPKPSPLPLLLDTRPPLLGPMDAWPGLDGRLDKPGPPPH